LKAGGRLIRRIAAKIVPARHAVVSAVDVVSRTRLLWIVCNRKMLVDGSRVVLNLKTNGLFKLKNLEKN
jgi:hypothetical protein